MHRPTSRSGQEGCLPQCKSRLFKPLHVLFRLTEAIEEELCKLGKGHKDSKNSYLPKKFECGLCPT